MVVFVELPQEVALVRQAEDRAHRHGQRNPVNVYFLMAKGTGDERRWVQGGVSQVLPVTKHCFGHWVEWPGLHLLLLFQMASSEPQPQLRGAVMTA